MSNANLELIMHSRPALKSGSMPLALKSGSMPLALKSGSMPPALKSGSMPPALKSGSMLPALKSGSMPPALKSGSMPPALKSGSMPLALTVIPSVLQSNLPWTKVCTDQNATDVLIVPLDGAGNDDRLREVLAPPVEYKSGPF